MSSIGIHKFRVNEAELTPAKCTVYFCVEDFFWFQYCTKGLNIVQRLFIHLDILYSIIAYEHYL